jgi:hypothetical protein
MSNIRLSERDIKDTIVAAEYQKMGSKTVVCLATLKNGFELVGVGSCVDPSNFDMEIGKEVAMENVVEQIWRLEGYRLQCENPCTNPYFKVKKPIVIEAWQFTKKNFKVGAPDFIRHSSVVTLWSQYGGRVIGGEIKTLEDVMKVSENDYIIKDINGELYSCKPDIFENTYEEIQ